MKPAVKASLILLITLLIGIAIGFEISEISIRKRFEEPDSFRRPEGFIKIFERIIQPEKEQKPTVDSILLKYHTKIDSLARTGMFEVSRQMDSMKIMLGTVLNKEQIRRLDEEMTRMRREPPGNMKMRGQPPDDLRMKQEPPPNDMRMRQEPPDDKRIRKDPPDKRP